MNEPPAPQDSQSGQADNANFNQSRQRRFWQLGKCQAHWSKSCTLQKRRRKRAGITREHLESHISYGRAGIVVKAKSGLYGIYNPCLSVKRPLP